MAPGEYHCTVEKSGLIRFLFRQPLTNRCVVASRQKKPRPPTITCSPSPSKRHAPPPCHSPNRCRQAKKDDHPNTNKGINSDTWPGRTQLDDARRCYASRDGTHNGSLSGRPRFPLILCRREPTVDARLTHGIPLTMRGGREEAGARWRGRCPAGWDGMDGCMAASSGMNGCQLLGCNNLPT